MAVARPANDPEPKRRTRGQGEGSIYQRESDGKWVAAVNLGWQDGKRQRKYLYGATRAEVADKLTEALGRQRRGQKIAFERQTVAQFLRQWHAEVIAPDLRPNSVRAYRNAIEHHLVPALGHIQLDRLSAQDVQTLLARCRRRGHKPETIAGILSVLKLAMKQAERLDLVPRNVATLVDRPRITRYEPHPLTPPEAQALLVEVSEHRLSALYEVSVRVGLRQAEALGLQWRDVDLERGTLTVRHQLQRYERKPQLVPPKTERSRRIVELTPPLVAILRAHRQRQEIERQHAGPRWQPVPGWALVFCSPKGKPLWPSDLRKHLQGVLAGAGLAPRRWHDLRHTAVTLMLGAGVPERVVMEIMGHSSLDMTRIYGSILPASRLDALARVDDLLRPERRAAPRGRPRKSANGCKRRLHGPARHCRLQTRIRTTTRRTNPIPGKTSGK